MRGRGVSIVLILAIVVGAYLVLDGISGLVVNDSIVGRIGRALGTEASAIRIVVAIVEIVAGALLLVSRFVDVGRLAWAVRWVVFIGWLVVMVLVLVVRAFEPDTLAWWVALLQYGIVLVAIWVATGEQ